MMKAMIVDDEEWVRLGLREQIDWDSLGLEIVGEAQNGVVAVEIIEEKRPEIVITDIRMPKMDGIALMEYVHKKYPDILLIVISGYSEFEYAKKAISFCAFDYILKPIEEEILEETLRKAVIKQRENENKKDTLLSMKAELNKNSRLMLEKNLTDLLLNRDTSSEEKEKAIQKLGLDFFCPRMAALVFKAANFHETAAGKYNNDMDLASFALFNVIEELLGDDGDSILFRNYKRQDELLLIKGFNTDEYKIIIEDIYGICRQVVDSVRSYIGFEVYIGIGGEFTSLKDAGKSFDQALEAVQNAGMLNGDRIVHFDNISSRNDYFIFPDDKEKALIYYVENNYRVQAGELIDKLFGELEENRLSNPKSIRSTVLELTVSINKLLKKHGFAVEGHKGELSTVDKVKNELFTAGELKEWFKASVSGAMDFIGRSKRTGTRKAIDQIVEYVNIHYGEGVNLNGVSAQFFINPAYLSRMFKNETGQNFNDYLSKIRMEAAVKLLKNEEFKMNTIAEMIGYENVNYFLKKFKEYYGCTPTEYKKGLYDPS